MRPLAAGLIVALTLLPACRRAPADPVKPLLAELEAAAETRDAERLAGWLGADFRSASGLGRAEAVAQLKRYFAAYESVAIEVYGVETEREPKSARVRCIVEFSGTVRKAFGLEGLFPPSAAYRFDLDVADDAGVWRVRGAAWTPAEPKGS